MFYGYVILSKHSLSVRQSGLVLVSSVCRSGWADRKTIPHHWSFSGRLHGGVVFCHIPPLGGACHNDLPCK